MRNPKIKKIVPNYKKNVLHMTVQEGAKSRVYHLPFSAFRDKKIGVRNKFVSIDIDKDLGSQSASFILQDGSKGDFPADLALYYGDPSYQWSPLNQLKRVVRDKIRQSKISFRVLADILKTSPSQVMRLLDEETASKQVSQLFRIAEVAGYQVEFHLKKRLAA